jgi:hypothetical protein
LHFVYPFLMQQSEIGLFCAILLHSFLMQQSKIGRFL